MKSDRLRQFISLREALLREKAELQERLAELDRALTLDGAAELPRARRGPLARRSRISNPMSLKQAVLRVTKGRALNKSEILAAIHKVGYRFATRDPVNSLNSVLYLKKLFKHEGGRFSPV